jgi:UDP-N-acetylglucosamine diphosphorylase/glucosamine-1-phosphate N-acetyltransferase
MVGPTCPSLNLMVKLVFLVGPMPTMGLPQARQRAAYPKFVEGLSRSRPTACLKTTKRLVISAPKRLAYFLRDSMKEKMAVVLAAGKGTRMKSDLPKVLVRVCGRPMIEYVLDALSESGIERILAVIGYRAELVRAALDGRKGLTFILQTEQLGTGHAVMVCRELLADYHGPLLVVAGDSPLMQAKSISALLAEYESRPAACILGTTYKDNPEGLGRVIRDNEGNFLAVVEHRDATDQQRRIKEVSLSYYVFNCQDMLDALDYIRPDNKQGEYYITDVPGVLLSRGLEVRALPVLQPCEALSINNIQELKAVEAEMNRAAERKQKT